LKYRIAADFDFFIRAIEAGVRLVPTDEFLVNYRMSGMSETNLPRTLRENRDILAAHTGRWSRHSLVYSISYYKSSFLIFLQSLLRERIGDAALNAARGWYLRTFFAREREPLKTEQRR
jgi:hypothetical protein